MANLTPILNQLQHERSRLTAQLERLNNALSALTGLSKTRKGRTVSAAGRARMAAAQRARWAKAKGKVVPITAHKKRKLSGAAIAHIRAAQKARWAKWRKQKKG